MKMNTRRKDHELPHALDAQIRRSQHLFGAPDGFGQLGASLFVQRSDVGQRVHDLFEAGFEVDPNRLDAVGALTADGFYVAIETCNEKLRAFTPDERELASQTGKQPDFPRL